MAEAAAWLERALVHANACGDLVTRRTVTQSLSMGLCWGPDARGRGDPPGARSCERQTATTACSTR